MSSKKPKASNKTSLVFFGTGQTSVEALQCLAEDFEIELVITKPPAQNSAGKLFKNQVQLWAEENEVNIIAPSNKSELATDVSGRDVKSRIGVVLDYGMIIPEKVINIFPDGILNSHFSLLPKYRGADPIRSAILNGDEITGVTIIRITPGLDDGPILTWAELPIENMNATELREKLSNLNCALLPETIRLYLNQELEPVDQDPSQATQTTKTTKEDGKLNPNKAATQLEREVRAYTGWPKSYFEHNNNYYIVHSAKATDTIIPTGEIKVIDKKLMFGCKDGSLEIVEIQSAGKPKMNAEAFINGFKI